MKTMMVVTISTSSGIVFTHEGPVEKDSDMAAIFSEATHSFRLKHPNVSLSAGETEAMPNIAISHYFKP